MKENEKIEVQVLVHTEDACEKVKELIEELKKANSLADELAKKKYRSHKGVIGTDTIKGFLTPGTMKMIRNIAKSYGFVYHSPIGINFQNKSFISN